MGNIEFILDSDVLSEEAEKQLIDEIKHVFSKKGNCDMDRLEYVFHVYRELKRLAYGVKVICKFDRKFGGLYATVNAIGDGIHIEYPKELYKMCVTASNFEVYPRTDGKVQLNLGFYGVENG